jgi:cholesterol transport system auxiliary component
MSRHRVNALLCSILALSALAIGGCGQGSYGREYYIIEAVRNAGPAEAKSDESLEIRRFNISTAFASRNLIYRLGEYQYEPDYYRQFLIAPAIMITEETRHWLAGSGLFKLVLPSGSQITPTYTLQGIVTALYGDFTDKAAPTAVVRIRFFLMQHKDGSDTVVFSQAYRTASPLPDRTGRSLIDAFSKDMAEMLTQLEADLAKFLATKPD